MARFVPAAVATPEAGTSRSCHLNREVRWLNYSNIFSQRNTVFPVFRDALFVLRGFAAVSSLPLTSL